MHIKLTNGAPETYSIAQLRSDNPQVSFPQDIPEDTLAEFSVFPVQTTEPPTASETEVVESAGYLQLPDKTWIQAWSVRPMNTEEIEALSAEVRAERNQRLSKTDWTQVADAPVDAASWAVYRQALRDISIQQGFPFNIIWPETPSSSGIGRN
jgi:hypothetical protein